MSYSAQVPVQVRGQLSVVPLKYSVGGQWYCSGQVH